MGILNKKVLIIVGLIIIVAIIGIATITITPSSYSEDEFEGDLLQQANDAITIVLTDQKDGSLSGGTVVKINSEFFIYDENQLFSVNDIPDVSSAVTTARIRKNNTTVYLLSVDGEDDAHGTSSEIIYEKLIDPDNDKIETYKYSQINSAVKKFLIEVSYEGAEDSVSEVAKYIDSSERLDRPAGCTVDLKAGELTIFDNGTKNGYTITVEDGPFTFYNLTPGVGGEFYVKNGDKVVQQGHLRPNGFLRMIYSDTPGLQNMRDLGGWPCDGGKIKYNMLFRGGMVIDTTDKDRNTWVKLLGIDLDLFLKTYEESQFVGREEFRTKSPLGENVAFYQKDLSAENSENKRNFLTAKEQMNGIFNQMFDNAIAGKTTYFHCLAGADRTGMVAIITEGILGVSKSDIDKDYELTSFSTLRERNGVMYTADINIIMNYPGANFRDKCVQYLLDCGITLEKINAFRKAVIEGTPEELVEIKIEVSDEGSNFCIPNGEGWIDNGRSSSTGADRNDADGFILTNYFAVQNGDIVCVKNMHISDTLYSGIYDSDKTAISGFFMADSTGTGFVKDVILSGEWEQFTVDNPNAGYLRLCGTPKYDKTDVVIKICRNGKWI